METDSIIELLKMVMDPELNVNIYDLGLVYAIDVRGDHVDIEMTMTTRGCPMSDAIVGGVKQTLMSEKQIRSVDVDVVWTPPWSPDQMSEDAKEQLGYF